MSKMDFSQLSQADLDDFLSWDYSEYGIYPDNTLSKVDAASVMFSELMNVSGARFPEPVIDLYLSSIYTGPKDVTYTYDQIMNLTSDQAEMFSSIFNLTSDNLQETKQRIYRILSYLGLTKESSDLPRGSTGLPEESNKGSTGLLEEGPDEKEILVQEDVFQSIIRQSSPESAANLYISLTGESKEKVLEGLLNQTSYNDWLMIYNYLGEKIKEHDQKHLQPKYMLFDVGYVDRLDDGLLNQIYNESEYNELNAEILYLKQYDNVRFDAFRNYNGAFVEHPEARQVFDSMMNLGENERNGIMVKFNPYKEGSSFLFVEAVATCEHCAFLEPATYQTRVAMIEINGTPQVVEILMYDTESG